MNNWDYYKWDNEFNDNTKDNNCNCNNVSDECINLSIWEYCKEIIYDTHDEISSQDCHEYVLNLNDKNAKLRTKQYYNILSKIESIGFNYGSYLASSLLNFAYLNLNLNKINLCLPYFYSSNHVAKKYFPMHCALKKLSNFVIENQIKLDHFGITRENALNEDHHNHDRSKLWDNKKRSQAMIKLFAKIANNSKYVDFSDVRPIYYDIGSVRSMFSKANSNNSNKNSNDDSNDKDDCTNYAFPNCSTIDLSETTQRHNIIKMDKLIDYIEDGNLGKVRFNLNSDKNNQQNKSKKNKRQNYQKMIPNIKNLTVNLYGNVFNFKLYESQYFDENRNDMNIDFHTINYYLNETKSIQILANTILNWHSTVDTLNMVQPIDFNQYKQYESWNDFNAMNNCPPEMCNEMLNSFLLLRGKNDPYFTNLRKIQFAIVLLLDLFQLRKRNNHKKADSKSENFRDFTDSDNEDETNDVYTRDHDENYNKQTEMEPAVDPTDINALRKMANLSLTCLSKYLLERIIQMPQLKCVEVTIHIDKKESERNICGVNRLFSRYQKEFITVDFPCNYGGPWNLCQNNIEYLRYHSLEEMAKLAKVEHVLETLPITIACLQSKDSNNMLGDVSQYNSNDITYCNGKHQQYV